MKLESEGAEVGAKFYFFTDPALLGAQTLDQAFGPMASDGINDFFRATDSHTLATGAPVLAICDGLICAQDDENGNLTLIQKVAEQPPFDFPAISYILYKGVDRNSLLAPDGRVDIQQTDNKLVEAVRKAWELEDNDNGTTTPSSHCLGLNLNPNTYAVTADRPRFADSAPMDNLFYIGDPMIQLALARGGWKLGTFTASGGVEIIVERIGRRPKIGLARQSATLLSVPTLPAGADPSDTFRHWDAKEAALDFIDPCALWGSFFVTKLRVWNSGDFEKLSGNAIYETVLRGAAQGAANFANRNRAYIDIRNEHGQSINYYQSDGPNIQLTLDPEADIDTCEVNYYGTGWPCFWVDNANLQADITGDRIEVRFALPKTTHTWPLIYMSVGYRGRLRTLKEGERFLDPARRRDSEFLFATSMTLPLANNSGTRRLLASYSRLHHFKRLAFADGQAVPPASASLTPARTTVLDCLMPFLDPDDLPVAATTTAMRTYDDYFYVESGIVDSDGFVACPALAVDSLHVVQVLVPKARYTSPFGRQATPVAVSWPKLTLPGDSNIFAYLANYLPGPPDMVKVADPEGVSTDGIELIVEGDIGNLRHAHAGDKPSVVSIALIRSATSALELLVSNDPTHVGLPMLTLVPQSSLSDEVIAYTSYSLILDRVTGAPNIGRVTQPTGIMVYSHDI